MQLDQNGARPSLYALVIYLPEPLCGFLDDLRLEMVPDSNPHAHVSVLPPRPLPVAPEAAIQEAREIVAAFPPFDVELGRVERFEATDVIYISVEAGGAQLRILHDRLNRGAMAFSEPFAYHPHITLAQQLPPERVAPLQDLAVQSWRDYRGPRTFHACHTVFVRNTQGNEWIDLAEGPLRAAPVS